MASKAVRTAFNAALLDMVPVRAQPGLEERGGVWIVIERIGGPGGQVEDHFEVEVLGEERAEIGEWMVED